MTGFSPLGFFQLLTVGGCHSASAASKTVMGAADRENVEDGAEVS